MLFLINNLWYILKFLIFHSFRVRWAFLSAFFLCRKNLWKRKKFLHSLFFFNLITFINLVSFNYLQKLSDSTFSNKKIDFLCFSLLNLWRFLEWFSLLFERFLFLNLNGFPMAWRFDLRSFKKAVKKPPKFKSL